MVSTSRILVAVVQMCYEAKDWDALNENIMLLTKRRSQLKQVRYFFFQNHRTSNACDLLHSFLSRFPTSNLCRVLFLIRLLPKWSKNVTSMWML